jgi:hypothetical protein
MKLKSSALTILSLLVFFSLIYWFTKPIIAVEYQNCSVSSSCVIGEFLYDDSYVPIATASCTLTSRYPDGTLFLNAAAMNASASGWYSYTAAIGTTEGIYPSQICCTASPDYLCLDKTFKVVTVSTGSTSTVSGITAADVWAYPNRSLTTFGTLVADIWNYSTRSLSNFGTLIADIWSRDSRTLTSTDSAALVTSIAEIKEIKQVTIENRLLLEQLINKPIVKTFIDENPLPNLTTKIQQTQTAAANLYSAIQNLKSRSQILNEKWSTLTENEVKSELSVLSSIFKQDINQKDTNILATTNWLKTSWNSPILLNLSDQAQAAQSQIGNLTNDINLYGKSASVDTLDTALSHIQKLDELIGTSLAAADDLSLYGFIKKTTEQIAFLDKQSAEGIRLLTEIKSDLTKDQSSAIAQYSNVILASNQLPQVDAFFIKSLKNTNTPVNKVLGLMAIVNTNKLLLAANTGQTIKNVWLEEGSIVFRAVAINPSHTISQKVTVKYYLPTELKKEQIIKSDPELVIDYDPVENALFASGEITLAPDETRTFLVEVEDIWNFRQEEIDSLKNQVNELVNLLKKSSSFAQATSIKSDIVVTLDKIMLRQKQAVTPEGRIQTYRESALDMNGVEQKITSLKELVVRSNTAGGFLGSIGGLGSVTLWGIVLIFITGFAFLIIYLNALRTDVRLKKNEANETLTNPIEEHDTLYHPLPKHRHRESRRHPGHKIARIASIALLVSGLGSVGASVAIKASQGRPVTLVSPSADAVVLGTSYDDKLPQEVRLRMPDSGKIPVRSAPSITSSEIMSLYDVKKVFVFRLIDNWAEIGLFDKDVDKGWWINTQYLELK